MRTPTEADLRLCPDNVQEYVTKLIAVAKAAKALTRPGDKLPKGTKAQSDYYMNAMKALDKALAEMEAQ
jgi:hypothetical protein